MKRPRYFALLPLLAFLLSIAAAPPSLAMGTSAGNAGAPTTIAVSGTLVVVPNEAAPETTRDASGTSRAAPVHGTTVSLVTGDGQWVRLTGPAIANAVTGTTFRGRLAVPAAVSRKAQWRSGRTPSPSAVLATAARLNAPMDVASSTLTSPATAAAATPMAHTIDVMYLSVEGDFAPAANDVQGALDRLNDFWTSESGGQVTSMTRSQAVKFRTVADTVNICDADIAWNEGLTAFGQDDVSAYFSGTGRHLVVIVPGSRCGVGYGLGSVANDIHRGGVTWSSVPETLPQYWDQVMFHEMGHNLGLWHSAQRICTSDAVDAPLVNNIVAAPCRDYTYRDFYDVMGGGYLVRDGSGAWITTNLGNIAALDATHRATLGAVPSDAHGIRPITIAGGRSQTATILPAANASGVRALEITDPTTDEKIYVEYRYPTGRDTESMYATYENKTGQDTYAPGVRILRAIPMAGGDTSTSTALSRVDASGTARMWWPPASTFTSHSNQVSVRVDSADASGASVTVSFAPLKTFTTVPKPTVAGTPSVGATLTAEGATPSSWEPAADSVTYQWLRDGVAISGATSQSYRATDDDADTELSVRATGVLSEYEPTASVSDAVTITAGSFGTIPKPVITGKNTVGALLTASGAGPSSWAPRADSVRYQWLRDDVPIPGATWQIHLAERADLGTVLTVRATGSRAGYASASSVSDGVKIDPAPERPNASVRRIFGKSRYATAVKASYEAFPRGRTTPVLYLADGYSWHDSVAASSAAEYERGALLLVPRSGYVPWEVRARIAELAPSKIVIVGDTRDIRESIVSQVKRVRPSATYTRIPATNQYATSRAVTEYAFSGSTGKTVWVADGRTYGLATIASRAAGHRGEPVILVDGSKPTLDAATLATIAKLEPRRMFVIGNASRVSSGIEDQLRASTPTYRLSGRNQYEAAVKINSVIFPGAEMPTAYLISGQNWVEATTIGVYATRTWTPVFLTPRRCVPASVLNTMAEKKTKEVGVVGGPGSISTTAAWLRSC